MPDNEIKKALECCRHDDYDYCEECPYRKNKPCQENLIQDCFDLINRKDQENETLKAEVERLREIRDLCNATILEKNEQIEKLKISDASKEECTIKQHGEIKELKAKNERLKKEVKKCKEHYKMACSERNEFLESLENAKAEAYKEFAEKANEIIDLIVDLMFDDSVSKCQLPNCHKPLSIPCENEICIQENKEYWHSKLDNLLKELVGNQRKEDGKNDIKN